MVLLPRRQGDRDVVQDAAIAAVQHRVARQGKNTQYWHVAHLVEKPCDHLEAGRRREEAVRGNVLERG